MAGSGIEKKITQNENTNMLNKVERKCPSISRKHVIGTWNVRSLYAGKLQVVLKEMKGLKIEVLGLTEVRWKGNDFFCSDDFYIGPYRLLFWTWTNKKKWCSNYNG